MPKKLKIPEALTELRRRAELGTLKHQSTDSVSRPELDSQRLLHELEVHQIELEMQNVELRLARDEAETAREKYTDLYDFAPVGYFTLSPDDRIRMANLTGADIVGIERSRLLGRSFGLLVSPETRDGFTRTLKQVFDKGTDQAIDVKLLSKDPPEKVMTLKLKRTADGSECNVALVDITERIKAELAQRQLDVMTASNTRLKQEIFHRQAVEKKLHETEHVQCRLLEHSLQQQVELRGMSHKILQAQEAERKRISRELHDVITQTLVGINVHVAALAQETATELGSLQQRIADTHKMVERSVEIVHQFAQELRPTVLDDLGLIPALQAYLKGYMETTGIRTSLMVSPSIEESSESIRTTFYRIIQEALTNVAKHTKASQVEISIRKMAVSTSLEITDDGHGFEVEKVVFSKHHKRLGLLGMRERAEMVGGEFSVDSAPGKPTTIRVTIKTEAKTKKRISSKKSAKRPGATIQ
jgi:PAS domain S-box-containing protein